MDVSRNQAVPLNGKALKTAQLNIFPQFLKNRLDKRRCLGNLAYFPGGEFFRQNLSQRLKLGGSSAKYLSKTDVPQTEIEKEKEIYTELLKKEGKPEASIPKIVEGKINKLFYQSLCLLEQLSIRDNKTSIAQMIKETATQLGAEISVTRFARYQLGE